jgi:hypothetical protein
MIRPAVKEVFNYNEMADHINKKFNVYIDDFAGRYHLPGNKKAPCWFLEWTKKTYGVKDMDDLGKIQKNDITKYYHWFDEYRYNYEKDEPPYQNFWHFILDALGGEISNGHNQEINFVDLKDIATEDWQHKVLDMFIEEFGSKPVHVEFSW